MSNKILLLGHMRSGSTQYYDSFNLYHQSNPNYIKCMGEVYSSPYNESYYKFFNHYNLDKEKIANKNPEEMLKAFIYAMKNNTFMIKYFPYLMKGHIPVVTTKMVIKQCKKYDVQVHFLYRKNLLDMLISLIVSLSTNIYHNNNINPVKIKFEEIKINNDILNQIILEGIEQIKITFDEYKIFNNANMIDKIMTYEDDIVTGNYLYASEKFKHRRMNSSKSKEIILYNHPNIKKLINEYCNKYNLVINNNYEINFDKTINKV